MFCREYLVDLNASGAARRAGYSERTSNMQGYRLLTKAYITAEVQRLMGERARRLDISADAVLAELAKLAFVNVRDLFDDSGRLIPAHQLPVEVAAAVSSIKVKLERVPGGEPTDVEAVVETKLWDKKGSLELLGKHLRLFDDRGGPGADETPEPISTTTIIEDASGEPDEA